MKRKLLSAVLSVAMVATLLVGCGSSGASNNAPAAGGDSAGGSSAAEAPAAGGDSAGGGDTAAAGGDNTLTVWCWDPAFNMNAMYEAEKVYQKDHPDFKLNVIETPWEDVQTKLTTAATSNQLDTLPDIFLMQDNAFQKNVLSFPDAVTDLTNTGIDFSQFAPAKTAYSVIDGKNYGVPFDNGAVIACYRTDILEQAGYTIDDFTDITWDEYLEKSKDVLAKTGKPMLSAVQGETDVICMMLQSTGGSFFDANGNPTMAGNDKLKAVMDMYAELVKSGVLIEATSWDEYIKTLNSETVASTINGCWIMASIKAADDQSGKWAVTNMPKFSNVADATNYSNNGGSSWAVSSNCKNVELAADFLGSTFGGSTELYDAILPTGALATYLPAGDSPAYGEADAFFGGDAVSQKITEYAGKTPSINTGAYYYEARDAVAVAITNVISGANIDTELEGAESTVKFAMGQ